MTAPPGPTSKNAQRKLTVNSGFHTKTDLSPAQMAHSIVCSRLNTKYIQPHYPLSDNMVSHAIQFDTLIELKNKYAKYGIFIPVLQTKYHDLDRVLVVTQSLYNSNKEVLIIYRNDQQVLTYDSGEQTTLEYIGENRFKLDNDSFPIKKQYHHERQAVVHVLETPQFRLELEVLLTGLDTYSGRKQVMSLDHKILENSMVLGSFSFRFIVKDGIVPDELSEHIEQIQSLDFKA